VDREDGFVYVGMLSLALFTLPEAPGGDVIDRLGRC
jgi:hypothetical protein